MIKFYFSKEKEPPKNETEIFGFFYKANTLYCHRCLYSYLYGLTTRKVWWILPTRENFYTEDPIVWTTQEDVLEYLDLRKQCQIR